MWLDGGLCLTTCKTYPTHYYLESSRRVAYMETCPQAARKLEWMNKPSWIPTWHVILLHFSGFCKARTRRTKGEGEREEKRVVFIAHLEGLWPWYIEYVVGGNYSILSNFTLHQCAPCCWAPFAFPKPLPIVLTTAALQDDSLDPWCLLLHSSIVL